MVTASFLIVRLLTVVALTLNLWLLGSAASAFADPVTCINPSDDAIVIGPWEFASLEFEHTVA